MKQKFRYVAPEGGWGILICIGISIPFATALAILPSFGLVFGDFLSSIGAETSEISFITSSYFLSLSTAGLFSGSLFKRFGLRRIAIIAGIFLTAGSFIQIFVTSTLDLLIAFSLLQGIGFGFIVPAFYTIFHEYFVEKRVLWMGFAQTVIGVLVMFFPVVMQALREQYGFRGALAILCAINANSIAGMLIMHPVEWHMRKIPITDHELLEKTDHISMVTKESDPTNAKIASDDSHQNSPLMVEPEKLGPTDLKSRSNSLISMGNWGGPLTNASPSITRHHSIEDNSKITKNKSTWQVVVDFLDLSLLKNPIYVNISVGVSCILYSDIAFFTLQSLYLFELGFNKQDTSKIIAIGAAADLISRIVLVLSAIFIKTSSRNIYLAGAFFSILCRFAFLEVRDFVGVACITAIMGFLRTWIHVPLALVFGEYLPKDRFPTGYGLFMFMQGVLTFAFGPVIGYMRDATRSYVVTFHVLNAIMGLSVLAWLLEFAYLKFVKKLKPNLPMEVILQTDKILH